MVNNKNYIVIQGWMINELHLKGNDLLIYALIYGFTQDGEEWFEGSRQYIADWCNSDKRGIHKNLQSLVKRNLLIKEDKIINNVKFCKYKANLDLIKQSNVSQEQDLVNIVHHPSEHSSPPQ